MKTYISGQITGLTQNEYERRFRLAEKLVRWRKDFNGEIINPLNLKPFLGIECWLCRMIACIYVLRKCDAIAMQSNWIESRGAVIEFYAAKFIFKLEIIWL